MEYNQKKVKKKKKKRKLLRRILLVILLVILIAVGWFIYKTIKNGGGISGMLATLVGHDENTRKNLGEFNCLLLGISTDQDGVDLTDTIMVLSYNPATQKATLLSIPRDTYTGTNPNRATAYEKINALYSRKHRADETLAAVNQITGLDIPYYIVIKTEGLIKLVDIIGGVKYDVPIDMNYDDDTQNLHIHLKAGEQMLDGDKAEQLVRFRHNNDFTTYPLSYGDNDTGRMRTQREFIMQVMKQTLKPDNIWKIFDIIDLAKEFIITNVNYNVAKDYVPYAVEFNTIDLLTDVLPGSNTNKNPSGTWVFVPDKIKTKKMVQELFYNRDLSDEEIAKLGNSKLSNDDMNKLSIQIINGSGDSNKLEIALHEVKSLGYKVDILESNEVEKTVIINQKDVDSEKVRGIKDTLQKGIIQTSEDKKSTYDIKIILGKDYEEETN